MRTIMYAIFNKNTNERIYTNISLAKCTEELDRMYNKEDYEIRHKWFSI